MPSFVVEALSAITGKPVDPREMHKIFFLCTERAKKTASIVKPLSKVKS